jgi:ribonuclease P protein component
MLAKKARLTGHEVREILKSGRLIRTPSISVKYRPGEQTKVGVVVSKKVAKKAVKRNQLRRAIYDVLGRVLPENVQAVFFLHTPLINESEITALCSKLF